jgi:hypothetical protein
VNLTSEYGDAASAPTTVVTKAVVKESFLDYTFSSPTYDGLEHAVSVTAKTDFDDLGAITVKYNDATDIPVDAGSYEVTVDISESAYYQETTGLSLGNFTIDPKPVTITVKDGEKLLGEDDTEFTGIVSGLINNSDLGTITYNRTNDEEAVGQYDLVVTADYTSNTNYKVKIYPGNFTIHENNSLSLTVTALSAEKNYDGQPLVLNADAYTSSLTGAIRHDNFTVTASTNGVNVTNVSDNAPDNHTVTSVTVLFKGKDITNGINITKVAGTAKIVATELTITPDDFQSKIYGQSDPESFSYKVSGWENNEQPEIFAGALTREENEKAGAYKILQGTLHITSSNYNLIFTEDVYFTINPADVSIIFEPETDLILESNYYQLSAIVSSGMPAQFQLRPEDENIAEIKGDKLILKQTGVIEVTAYVEPNENYITPEPISYTISITSNGGMTDIAEIDQSTVRMYPNPAEDYVTLSGLQGGETLRILNANGRTLITHHATNSQETVPVSSLSKGTYFVRIMKNSTAITLKLIKK